MSVAKEGETQLKLVMPDMDVDPVAIDAFGVIEVYLKRTRQNQKAIAAILGPVYTEIGDVVFQLLCEIAISQIEGRQVSIADLAQNLDVPDARLERIVTILEREQLVENREAGQDCPLLTTEGKDKLSLIFQTRPECCAHLAAIK